MEVLGNLLDVRVLRLVLGPAQAQLSMSGLLLYYSIILLLVVTCAMVRIPRSVQYFATANDNLDFVIHS